MGMSTICKHKLLHHHLSQFFQSTAWPHQISWEVLSSQSIVASSRTVRPCNPREVDGLDIGRHHGQPFDLLRHNHKPQRRPISICANWSGNVQHRCKGGLRYLCAEIAISARIQLSLCRDSYLWAHLAISVRRQLSLVTFSYLCAEIAISAQRQLSQHAFSYLCAHLAIHAHIQLNLHAYIALKRVRGKHGILSEENLVFCFSNPDKSQATARHEFLCIM